MKKQSGRNKIHVKVGDMVELISGVHAGERGEVASVSRKEKKVIVEGVNISVKHVKPTQQGVAGTIERVASPMYCCKVMLVCPKCDRTTRVAHGTDESGLKKRKCKRCGNLF